MVKPFENIKNKNLTDICMSLVSIMVSSLWDG